MALKWHFNLAKASDGEIPRASTQQSRDQGDLSNRSAEAVRLPDLFSTDNYIGSIRIRRCVVYPHE
jgi:hypothetical protein